MLKFDLYRKLPQDLIEPSKSGALISFSSLILMLVLFITEFQEYLTQQVQTEMYIEQNKDDQLLVNMDISFPKMPCDFISIDQQDVIGTHQQNVKGDLLKKRTLNGRAFETYPQNELLNLERAQKAFEDGEGCDLLGYIIISRVPGNFHISAHPYGGQMNIVLPFAGLSTIDLSHTIRHLSFGNQKDLEQIRKRFKQGLLNPLDGISRIKTKEVQNVAVTHQYYISIVPTIYVDIDNKEYFVNQFTANTNEAQTSNMPAIYFRYDISPVTVQFTKYYQTLGHFLVQICAILGGIFTIAGILDSIFYACMLYLYQCKKLRLSWINDDIIQMNQQKIRVAVRIRPLLDNEIRLGQMNSKIESNDKEVQVKEERARKSFKFDHVLPETATQAQVYRDCEIDQLITSVIDGYHATIFAYGQTGSGKTYTMEGQLEDGIIPKAINGLFQKINKKSTSYEYTVYCSYLQIYNEKIYDLLGGINKINGELGNGLKLRWNVRNQFTVEKLFIYQCKSADDVMQLFKLGVNNRITASHKLNVNSSRSHSILELKIESVDIKNPDQCMTSKLELVDLAGSERISLTGTEGKQAKESIEINKSLMTLRQVIAILADSNNKTIPPYRDSKLTCLLKQSIGGNSFCLMIACIAPIDQFYDENISTLQYATKAAYITNIPIKNDDPKNKVIADLKQQITDLKIELNKANEHIEFLTTVIQKNKKSENNYSNSPNNSKNINNLLQNQQRLLEESEEDLPKFEYTQFNERLVDSINMVRELLLSNKEMREREEQINVRCDQMQKEIIVLQRENFELREKLGENEQRESPLKRPSTIKRNTMMGDERGFLPEQTTQFQKNIMKDYRDTPNKDYREPSMQQTNRNMRAYSQRTQGRQLPQIICPQSNFEEVQQDEMTNFGRRSLYQKQMK